MLYSTDVLLISCQFCKPVTPQDTTLGQCSHKDNNDYGHSHLQLFAMHLEPILATSVVCSGALQST